MKGGEPVEVIIRYHAALRELTGRRGIRDDLSRYETIAVAMVESNIGTPGKVLDHFPPVDSPLRIEEFFQAVYLRYDERYVYAAPDLKKITRRREWSKRSPSSTTPPTPHSSSPSDTFPAWQGSSDPLFLFDQENLTADPAALDRMMGSEWYLIIVRDASESRRRLLCHMGGERLVVAQLDQPERVGSRPGKDLVASHIRGQRAGQRRLRLPSDLFPEALQKVVNMHGLAGFQNNLAGTRHRTP